MIAFGPIPSRRLGYSLGINNIPPKYCSYGCIYCQVGQTNPLTIERQSFFTPEKIREDVELQIRKVKEKGGFINCLSFVPDGEPTLDINLRETIQALIPLGYPIAVFTNASLIWQEPVQEALMLADWVSLKVDSVDEPVWRKLNLPHGHLSLQRILDGIETFAAAFNGYLATETMLLKNINDSAENICNVADFLVKINPSAAYIAIPTRPTTYSGLSAPEETKIEQAYQIFNEHYLPGILLTGEDTNDYGFTGNAEEDLLRITAVQPMTADAVAELLQHDNAPWDTVYRLIADGKLNEIRYHGNRFYRRRFERKLSREKQL